MNPGDEGGVTRREMIQGVLMAGACALSGCASHRTGIESIPPREESPPSSFDQGDLEFLEELERRATLYFWENGDPITGLVKDRSRADGPDERPVASIAAVGFGLAALCLASERGYLPGSDARERVRATLRYLRSGLPHEHGFYFHFVHIRTGDRLWQSELSSIDTAILMCGVLTCLGYYKDEEIRRLATQLYERVDWAWMLNGGDTFSHGWKPESGFLVNRWDHYCELMMLYLLGLGSPTHPVPSRTWHGWSRPSMEYGGWRYINPKAPLFVHQYSHAWFDFRGRHDGVADYYENSVLATRVHRQFCLDLRARFPEYDAALWGITASDSARGYSAWGGPPEQGKLDGSIVPCAAAGSLPFLPAETMRVLRRIRNRYADQVWKRYGFVDAFNPHTGWVNPDVIGIDVGISLLMAENARSGWVWDVFMRNRSMREAMNRAGFQPPWA